MDSRDLNRIRELAKEQLEIAKSPEMEALGKAWTGLNDCKRTKPLITVETSTFGKDVIPPLMECTTEEGRNWEYMLLGNIINHKYFGDDTFVRDFIPVNYGSYMRPFDIEIHVENTSGLGHHFVPAVSDLNTDFEKLRPSSIYISPKEEAEKRVEEIYDVLGGILPGKIVGLSMYSVPTQDIVHIMSMEDMYVAMYDTPDLFKKIMDMITDDYCRYFDELEKAGHIMSTVSSEQLSQWTYCFTNDLPKENVSKVNQIWGFMDSQETAGISPEMYEEFIFPYYKKVFDRYGLLSYGCCEALDPIWENCLSKVENLRKVSVSPWCNEEYIGEQLKGRKIVYHRKPSPNFLGVGKQLDEEALRKHIRKTLKAAEGCTLEFTQRDVYTVNNDMDKVRRYVEIVKEEIDNFR